MKNKIFSIIFLMITLSSFSQNITLERNTHQFSIIFLSLLVLITLLVVVLIIYVNLRILIQKNNKLLVYIQSKKELTNNITNMLTSLIIKTNISDEKETLEHIQNVGVISKMLAKKLKLPQEDITNIRIYAPIHDIGKSAISNKIWNKKGKLSNIDIELIKSHVLFGQQIVSQLNLGKCAENITMYHHEKWDGTGYNKIKGKKIPIEAQIVTFADIYDALRSKRSYKDSWTRNEVINYFKLNRGIIFNPYILKKFLKIEKDINKIYINRDDVK